MQEGKFVYAPFGIAQQGFSRCAFESQTSLSKVRILLADDHRQFLVMVERLLAPTCEVVGGVPDGQGLFDAARRLAPDVIVTDISMPTLNGIEASKQLNESGCAAKIIFLTVHSDADFV